MVDNNEPGYFYLHREPYLGINQRCCAFLPLAVTLGVEQFELCKAAKIAQLTENFQAKLGWLLGHMFSRVATVEWDEKYPKNKISSYANDYMNGIFLAIDEKVLKAAIGELEREKKLDGMTSDEIYQHVTGKKLLPRSKQFEARAIEFLRDFEMFNKLVRGRVITAIRGDASLKEEIAAALTTGGEPPADERVKEILTIFDRKVGELLSDAKVPAPMRS